jgi:mono/diheme cytochrome c family protein
VRWAIASTVCDVVGRDLVGLQELIARPQLRCVNGRASGMEGCMRSVRMLIVGFVAATAVVAAGVAARAQAGDVFEGKQKYGVYCASCHGAAGKGDGALAASLKKHPADLTQLARKNGGQFPTERVTRFIDGRTRDDAHLKSDMPVWGDAFSKSSETGTPEQVKARIDAVVKYLETIQATGKV